MRIAEMFSALTLNIVLALFSMAMAICALSLLAFVLAKETQTEKNFPRYNPREKIKRHESTTVDFRNPSTFPDHFLQLNTLMFQKRVKNNQVTPMAPINLESMAKMARQDEEDRIANRALPPIPKEISTNAVERHRRMDIQQIISTSFITGSPIEEEFSDTASTRSTDAPSSVGDSSTTDIWIIEKSTIEPLAEKITVDLNCGSEVSLC